MIIFESLSQQIKSINLGLISFVVSWIRTRGLYICVRVYLCACCFVAKPKNNNIFVHYFIIIYLYVHFSHKIKIKYVDLRVVLVVLIALNIEK